jgi:MFS family permease
VATTSDLSVEHQARDRRALQAVAVQFFINGVVVASYVPRLPGIRDRLGINLSTIGLVIAVATAGGVLGSAVVGSAIDRFGTKRAMMAGSLGLVGMLPVVGFVNTWYQLLLVLAFIAASDVLTDVAMNLQGSALSARRPTPIMNRLHGMWSLGTVVGGIVAAAMAGLEVSLRVHLLCASGVLLAALLYVVPGLLTEDDVPEEDDSVVGERRGARLVWLFGLLGAAAIVPEMINSDWAAFRLTDDLDASDGVAGLAYVSFTSGMVTGRMFGDGIVERLGSNTMLRVATVVAAVGVAIATLIPAVATVFIGLFIAGLGVSVMFPQLYDAAAKSPQSAAALGGLTAGSRIALLGAPALVGALANTTTFTVGSAIALVTIPAAVAVLVLTPSS